MHPLQKLIDHDTQGMSELEKKAYMKCFLNMVTHLGSALILGLERMTVINLVQFTDKMLKQKQSLASKEQTVE